MVAVSRRRRMMRLMVPRMCRGSRLHPQRGVQRTGMNHQHGKEAKPDTQCIEAFTHQQRIPSATASTTPGNSPGAPGTCPHDRFHAHSIAEHPDTHLVRDQISVGTLIGPYLDLYQLGYPGALYLRLRPL